MTTSIDYLCIPKIEASINKKNIIAIIEKTKICKIHDYNEQSWKYDNKYKKIMMKVNWNLNHEYYSILMERLQTNNAIKIVDNTRIIHIIPSWHPKT